MGGRFSRNKGKKMYWNEEDRQSVKKRYEAKFIRSGPDECWIWSAAVYKSGGHGFMQVKDPHPTPRLAHRIGWQLTYGEIPDGLQVLHTCDVPRCQNPKHLYLGTPADNMRDKQVRGRASRLRGEDCPASKLTWPEVLAIRKARASGVLLRVLAEKYGVGYRAISKIALGQRWQGLAAQKGVAGREPSLQTYV